MADSKAIAARVHPDVHEWMKEQAEKRGTTLGSYVEDVLRSHYNSHQVPDEDDSSFWEEPSPDGIGIESYSESADGEIVEVDAGSKSQADELREELPEYLHESDDRRLKVVRFETEVAPELNRVAYVKGEAEARA